MTVVPPASSSPVPAPDAGPAVGNLLAEAASVALPPSPAVEDRPVENPPSELASAPDPAAEAAGSSPPAATGMPSSPAGTAADVTHRMRPADALADLLAGNRRFVSGRPEHGHKVSAAAAASGGQQPHAVVLGCIDSRVPLEAIFDQTFGSICVVRSGGHVVDRAVLGSVGFAVSKLNVPLIMVLGHARCGAVEATVAALRAGDRPEGDVGYLVDEIAPAALAVGLDHTDAPARAMRVHVGRTVRRMHDVAGVPEAVAAGRVGIVGAVYDLDTGWVNPLP
jgi:carbonic anhydrase